MAFVNFDSDCKITTGNIIEFHALKNAITKEASIISRSAGIKTRKNMESSLAPSILAELIISLESNIAFCLNKYTRNGTERDTHITAKNVFSNPIFLKRTKDGINNVASRTYNAMS